MMRSSPSSTRLALGPGRAVLIMGPARVLVDIGSSGKSLLVRLRCRQIRQSADFGLTRNKEDGKVSRYRKGWDATARAAPPGAGAGRPACEASRPANANWDWRSAFSWIPL